MPDRQWKRRIIHNWFAMYKDERYIPGSSRFILLPGVSAVIILWNSEERRIADKKHL